MFLESSRGKYGGFIFTFGVRDRQRPQFGHMATHTCYVPFFGAHISMKMQYYKNTLFRKILLTIKLISELGEQVLKMGPIKLGVIHLQAEVCGHY